jgi:hypothetical protein
MKRYYTRISLSIVTSQQTFIFFSYCHENLTPHKPFFVNHEEEAMLFTVSENFNELVFEHNE